MRSSILVALLSAVAPALVAAAPGDNILFEDPGLSVLNDKYTNDVKPAKTVKINRWGPSIPVACKEEALKKRSDSNPAKKCEMNKMDVFQVWFDDAPEPWVVCRCQDQPMTEAEFITEIARVPVGIRQHVRTFMGFGTGGGAHATAGEDLAFFAKVSASVMLHESAHAVDGWQVPSTSKSGSQQFKTAVQGDSCWADGYARNNGKIGNLVEPWAQIFVLRRYQRHVGALPKNPACLQKQLDVVAMQTDALITAGYNAAIKVPPGPVTKKAD